MKKLLLIVVLFSISIRSSSAQDGLSKFTYSFAKNFIINTDEVDTLTKAYFFSLKVTIDKKGNISGYQASRNANKKIISGLDSAFAKIEKGILKSTGIKSNFVILPILIVNVDAAATLVTSEEILMNPWQFNYEKPTLVNHVLQPLVLVIDAGRPSERVGGM